MKNRRNDRFRILFFTLLVFLAGLGAGSLLVGGIVRAQIFELLEGGIPARGNFIFRQLDRELNLDGPQKEAIYPMTLELLEFLSAERRVYAAGIRPEWQKRMEKIREELRPEQKEEFNRILRLLVPRLGMDSGTD